MKFNWRSEINNDLAQWDLKELSPLIFLMNLKGFFHPPVISLYLPVTI